MHPFDINPAPISSLEDQEVPKQMFNFWAKAGIATSFSLARI